MRCIEISFPATSRERVNGLIKRHDYLSWSIFRAERERFVIKTVIDGAIDEQAFMDDLINTLETAKDWTITVVAPEAFVSDAQKLKAPKTKEASDEAPNDKKKSIVLREEIFESVSGGAEINTTYLALLILSAIVTSIGVNSDDVAVVIGGMVIAPLLGPLVGFSLGASLGDIKLIVKAAKALAMGIGLALLVGVFMGLILTIDQNSHQLQSRSQVSTNTLILALASGAAAGVSITSRLSSAFVGVMVAVALLPPTVASSLFFVAGEHDSALRALLLVLTNIVCVVFACQVTFILQNITPRSYAQKEVAKKSQLTSLFFWGANILLMAGVIWMIQNGT